MDCSTNKEDIKSAQALFAAYCAMNSGTTSFPKETPPPGDMSYYITDLYQYSSLESCAQVAVDVAALYQTSKLCPSNGPQALASCVCLKTMLSKTVSSKLTWEVRNRCNTKMLENLSSANEVLDYYCSAAKGEVTATGISGSSTGEHGTSQASGPSATETDSSSGSGHHKESKRPSAGVIAGAVVGAVLGSLVGAVIVFCIMRRRGRARMTQNAELVDQTRSSAETQVPVPQQSQSQASSEDGLTSPPHADIAAAPPPYEQAVYGGKDNKESIVL